MPEQIVPGMRVAARGLIGGTIGGASAPPAPPDATPLYSDLPPHACEYLRTMLLEGTYTHIHVNTWTGSTLK